MAGRTPTPWYVPWLLFAFCVAAPGAVVWAAQSVAGALHEIARSLPNSETTNTTVTP